MNGYDFENQENQEKKVYTCIDKCKHNTKLYSISSINNYWKKGSSGTITISFRDPNVSWCHIGTNCNQETPSMNLGFIDPPIDCFEYNHNIYCTDKDAVRNHFNEKDWVAGGTVLHEFCHALGMLHEHQNNLHNSGIVIVLDEEKVVNYYKSLGLPKEEAYKNVLDTYNENMHNEYFGTLYDRNSIMSYYLPDEWIKEGHKNPTKPNYELSEIDKKWLKKIYPMDTSEDLWPKLYIKFIDKDIELWKIAWVCKIVQEKIAPIVGIHFIFDNENFKIHDNEDFKIHEQNEENTENEKITENEKNTENKENKENEKKTENTEQNTENEKKNNIIIKNNTINFNGNVYSNGIIGVIILICSGLIYIYKYKGEFFIK